MQIYIPFLLYTECSLTIVGLVITMEQELCLGNQLFESFTDPETIAPRQEFEERCSRVDIGEFLERRDVSHVTLAMHAQI